MKMKYFIHVKNGNRNQTLNAILSRLSAAKANSKPRVFRNTKEKKLMKDKT
ncbi:hypothetical protein HanPSC8_Chr11g0491041 [Helianthus annuus]|nr:hypothetical protein HanPSC8_Chr11g0491041 [Helianthus annuus]